MHRKKSGVLSATQKPSRIWCSGWNGGTPCTSKVPPISGISSIETLDVEWTKQNPKARAALLSGPPGIGKTTSATLVCRHAGYEVIEMNASDKRNMAAVREHLQDSVGNTSESEEGIRHRSLSFERRRKKKVIVMDEVDGMSSGDRGGIQELIKVIKTTKTPIICICNDRDSPKVRTLASNCYDLQFTKPSLFVWVGALKNRNDMLNRVQFICQNEGLSLSPAVLKELVESTGSDFRQVLNQLQIVASCQHTQSDLSSILKSFSKDEMLSATAFEATKLLFAPQNNSLQLRYDAFFTDYEMTPLFVQQNYLDSIKSNGNPITAIEQMADAADALCDMERIHETMVKNNVDFWSGRDG